MVVMNCATSQVCAEQFVKRVLGTQTEGVTAIYDRYGYVKEMRRVVAQWVKELTAREPGNAVPREDIAA